jgi:hypothetical protein
VKITCRFGPMWGDYSKFGYGQIAHITHTTRRCINKS